MRPLLMSNTVLIMSPGTGHDPVRFYSLLHQLCQKWMATILAYLMLLRPPQRRDSESPETSALSETTFPTEGAT